MGRDAGHIALASGIAGGADVILIPEIPYTLEKIYQKISSLAVHGSNFALIIVAEGVKKEDGQPARFADPVTGRLRYGGIGHYLSEKITFATAAEARVTVLGHVQRGGQPCAEDRILAAKFGAAAVDLVFQESYNTMVALKGQHVTHVAIDDAVVGQKLVRHDGLMMRTARGLGICFGDV
jgi:6-phosphofructokinase 1